MQIQKIDPQACRELLSGGGVSSNPPVFLGQDLDGNYVWAGSEKSIDTWTDETFGLGELTVTPWNYSAGDNSERAVVCTGSWIAAAIYDCLTLPAFYVYFQEPNGENKIVYSEGLDRFLLGPEHRGLKENVGFIGKLLITRHYHPKLAQYFDFAVWKQIVQRRYQQNPELQEHGDELAALDKYERLWQDVND